MNGVAEEVYVFPLSFAQQRLWFMEQLLPGTPLFHLNIALRLNIPVDVSVLKRSLNEIVRRHEVLRTTYILSGEQPVQVVTPSLDLPLPVVDLGGLPPGERQSEALRLANEDTKRPFDLARGPLLRTTLLRLGPQEHVFLLTMHHIVSDGWSMGIFWKELAALWSAYAAGRPSPLPELPIQYADFAVWQREWLQGRVLNSQLDYWKRQLDNLTVLQLPTDRPRPATQTFSGALHKVEIPSGLTEQLRALSQREGVTLFMTLLAAFQTLLHRYTGQHDITLGTYIAGRNRAEIEPLIGFFLNSLVLRIQLQEGETFSGVLARVRKMTLDAYARQDLPFAKLVEELRPERDMSRNPIFQVMFQLLNVPTLMEVSALEPKVLDIERVSSVFDLSCMFEEKSDRLSGHFEYNTDLFDTPTIERMAAHYRVLLEGIVADPSRSLSELPLLTEAETRQLLVEWNDSERACPKEESLCRLFEVQAETRPEATAFVYEGAELSYGELNRRANRLARHLRARGVGRGSVVAVCLRRSLDYVVALVGVLKAGCVYLPMDAGHPRQRLNYVVNDARPAVVIAEGELAEHFSGQGVAAVCVEREREAIERQSDANPSAAEVGPDDLAYIIYTSGSTGRPKGIAVAHGQVLNRFHWMWEAYPFGAGEVCCQKTSATFVDSIWEFLGPLLRGVPTVIIPDAAMRDPLLLIRNLADHGVTRIWLVPSLLRLLLDAASDLGARLPALDFWVTSGEALPAELLKRFQEAVPSGVLYNLYGTSEVWDATWYDTREADGDALHRVPIGRPIDNVRAYVLDSHLRPVPVGVYGELHVGGVGLARGYLDLPAQTAGKFIPDPFSPSPGARMYKTGDTARYLPDGNLDYAGRSDDEVKVRGFRVAMGEIESTLSRHEGVSEAVVTAQDDGSGGNRLIAYLVLRNGDRPTASGLRDMLRADLPEYMIPADFVMLESLPLTASGKIDRQSLPRAEKFSPSVASPYVEPAGEAERVIAAVWQEVLRAERVGVRDNFFDLGGHSLLMFQVYSRLRNRLPREVTVNDLFRFPTVRALAQYVTEEDARRQPATDFQERAAKRRQAIGRGRPPASESANGQ